MLGVILLILCLVAILPVGVDGRYQSGKAMLFFKIGPLHLQLYPWKSNRRKRKDKIKMRQKKTRQNNAASRLVQDKRKNYRFLLKILFRTLQRFRRKLCINYLMLHYTAASSDPCDTVMQYGKACALIEGVFPLAKQIFHIKKQDIILDLTFETTKPIMNWRVEMTLHIWEICILSVQTLVELLRWKRKDIAKQKPATTEPSVAKKQTAMAE